MTAPDDPYVLGRRVDLLYRNLPLGQAASIINACLLTWVGHSRVDTPYVYVWFVAAVVMALARFFHALPYSPGEAKRQITDCGLLRRFVLLGAIGSGLIWAAGSLVLMLRGDAEMQLFTGFVMAGMIAGAVPLLAADLTIFRCYAIPITLAVAFGAYGETPLKLAFSGLAIMFLVAVMRGANLFYQTLNETFRLEHEKNGLVSHLEIARERAVLSDRAKTEFLANVSHELRTPMNGIMGFSELLADGASAEQRDLLRHLKNSAHQLQHQIDHLIELSALEAGHVQLHPVPFVLEDVLENLIIPVLPQIEAKGLQADVEEPSNLPLLMIGDVERLQQIFEHLLDNAIKFTQHGSIRLGAQLVEETQEQVRIAFSVADTGPGITPETLKLIEGLLVQADGSSVRRHGGIGIGLAIVRRLTALMGGQLDIDSQPGVGSTFRFTLPFALPPIEMGEPTN